MQLEEIKASGGNPGDFLVSEAEIDKRFLEGAERGELRAGLDPVTAPRLCLTGAFGYLIASHDQDDRRAKEGKADHFQPVAHRCGVGDRGSGRLGGGLRAGGAGQDETGQHRD